MNQNPEIEKLNKKAKEYSKMLKGIHAEMSKVIVGQDAVIENLILALATQGHVLLKGVPGLAKTLLIKTLADCIDLESQNKFLKFICKQKSTHRIIIPYCIKRK